MALNLGNLPNVPDIQATKNQSETDIRLRIDQYLSSLGASGENPLPGQDILGFLKLVQNAVRSREASESVPEGKGILILAKDPPEAIDTEAITFFLSARAPGQYSKGPMGSARVKEVVPHLRSEVQHPEHIGEKLITTGRSFDNWITFNIYARDDYTALKRVLWFENVMDSFRWYFGVHYIKPVLEQGVGEKQNVVISNLPLIKYPMTYFVRTEEIHQIGQQELKTFELNVDVSTNIEEGL